MIRGFDHLILPARDLDAQAKLYERLGFRVGSRNRHDWGTLNHIVQFPGVFLELIAIEPGFRRLRPDEGAATFANPIADYLETGEGFAGLVLEGRPGGVDHADFFANGIGVGQPFDFGRKGKRADGSEVNVAFTLSFAAAQDLAKNNVFFTCHQHMPQNFWNPALQQHANGVIGISEIVYVCDQPTAARKFFEKFIGTSATDASNESEVIIDSSRGRLEILSPRRYETRYGVTPSNHGLSAIVFRTKNLDAARKLIETNGVEAHTHSGQLMILPSVAHGVQLAFAPST